MAINIRNMSEAHAIAAREQIEVYICRAVFDRGELRQLLGQWCAWSSAIRRIRKREERKVGGRAMNEETKK